MERCEESVRQVARLRLDGPLHHFHQHGTKFQCEPAVAVVESYRLVC